MADETWIAWGGGERPVPRETLVDIRLRCGGKVPSVKADWVDWRWVGVPGSDSEGASDIVAYREVKK